MINRLTTFLFLIFIPLCGNFLLAQITKNASEYGLGTENSRDANTAALQHAFDAHLAGNLDILQISAGLYQINNAIDIKGWDGLSMIGETDENEKPITTLSTNTDNPIFIAKFTLNQIHSIKNGLIKNLTLKSTFNGTATHHNNPGLIFVGNVNIENLNFDNLEFTAPYADLNGFYVSNSSSPYETSGLTFKNCHFHHLGKMGIEITNHPNEGDNLEISRYNDIYFNNNFFEHLGLVTTIINGISETHGMGISLSGRGHNGLIQNNTFGENIANMNIENTGMNNLTIKNNIHKGSKGSMYQFSNPKWVVNDISISDEIAPGNYTLTPNIFNNINNIEIKNTKIKGDFSIENTENLNVLNSTIVSDYTKDEGYGTLRMSGMVKNILFDNCIIGELENLSGTYPVIFTYKINAENIQVKNSCLYGDYEIEEGLNPQVILENNYSDCDDIFTPDTEESNCVGIIPEYQLNGTWGSGENILNVDEGTAVKLSMLPDNIGLTITLPDGSEVGDNYDLGNVTSADNGTYTLTSEQGCVTTIELTVEVAIVTSNDGIVSTSAPKSIVRGSTTIVSVAYSASTERDIYVGFKLNGSLYQSAVIGVSAGSGTAEVPIAVPSDVLVENGTYVYQILLLPTGLTKYSNRLAEAYIRNVVVTDGNTTTGIDEITSKSAPKSIVRGSTTIVSVAYSASTDRDIYVGFKLNGSLYQSAVVSVSAGSGTAEIPIAVPSDVLVENGTYVYQILLLPKGHAKYINRLAEAYIRNVVVTDGTTTTGSSAKVAVSQNNNLLNTNEDSTKETISIYPNPTSNSVTVHIPSKESYTSFSLYSVNGAMVKAGKIDNNERELPISFSEMQKDIYILRLSNAKGEEAFKKIMKK